MLLLPVIDGRNNGHSITTGHCLAVDMLIRKFDSGPTQVCLFIKYHHPSTQSMSKTIIGWSVLPLPLPGALHTKFLYSFEDTTEGADYVISDENEIRILYLETPGWCHLHYLQS